MHLRCSARSSQAIAGSWRSVACSALCDFFPEVRFCVFRQNDVSCGDAEHFPFASRGASPWLAARFLARSSQYCASCGLLGRTFLPRQKKRRRLVMLSVFPMACQCRSGSRPAKQRSSSTSGSTGAVRISLPPRSVAAGCGRSTLQPMRSTPKECCSIFNAIYGHPAHLFSK